MHFTNERHKGIAWLWIVILAVLGLVSRLPFVSHVLFHWDSINFALAINHYDIAHHQPQPPGYILYVLLGRCINTLVANPQWTLVGMNIVGGTLAVIILYQLGRSMFSHSAGILSALFLLFCPLFWFYSEIAMPYIIDGLGAILIAWLFYRAEKQGKNSYFVPAAIALGLVGGFRQQTLAFMVPLAIYAMRKARFSQMVLAGGVSLAVFLGSFIPMVWLSGGWQSYRQAVSGLSDTFFSETSIFMGGGWAGLASNVFKWGTSTAYSLNLVGVLLLAWAIWKIRKLPGLLKDERAWFLAMWILPSLAFYTLVHMGSHGLIFTYLPAVCLISAKALIDLVAAAPARWQPKVYAVALGAILIVNGLLFMVFPERPLTGLDFKIVNWTTIRANDRFFDARFELIRNNIDPRQSVILATTWRHLQYYLPEYHVLSVPCGATDLTLRISEIVNAYGRAYQPVEKGDLENAISIPIQTVTFFDDGAKCLLAHLPEERIHTLSAEGENIYFLQLEPDETLVFNDSELGILRK